MSDQRTWTRRSVLRTSGAIAGVSALAGCIGADGEPSDESESYTVSMPPVGDVEFESVPETWATNNGGWADMGIALGQEPPEAVYLTSRFHTRYYDEIPDVSVDTSDIKGIWENGELVPEDFMSLSEDVDVFVMDPEFLKGRSDTWNEDEIERIEATGTPFFGNSIFSTAYDWHDHEFLTMYEAFEKLAEVFQEQERYEAFEELHDEFQSNVDDIVPPEDDRPEVAILYPTAEWDGFYPYRIDDGTSYKQWRDLGVHDALAEAGVEDFLNSRATVGYERLLEIDPEVILIRGQNTISAEEFQRTIDEKLGDHNVASDLTAVQEDEVYQAGFQQGPILNLVLTQRAAEQLYDVDEKLYDPQQVGDIVTGEF
ncbi:ABC transporter substrate-binding protein [Natrinema ejinorense]|uniref:Fe3+-hydroxamate ABC transporter substrate-binding protein n=1 Tax=Natrinema ejinorense TaxID=373386 RepID=A0A2A5QXB0_9EURY|nr:ABC transporter substrate-binding protein [Natrinema ejinorense]PCR91486.1 Fe3+-hydroxamate ABC transporter substrate-binding protein [Natrinema ejinorense]